MLVWRGHKARVRSLAFSPDGTRIATAAGTSKYVWLWDATSGKRVAKFGGDFYDAVRSVAFFPDGRHLAGHLEGGYVRGGGLRVWDVGTGKVVAAFSRTDDHSDTLAVSPDGTRLLVATDDGVAEWGEPTRPTPEATPRDPDRAPAVLRRGPTCVAFSPLGTYFCVGEWFLHLYDPSTFKAVRELRDPAGSSRLGASVTAFAFTPDESRLVVGTGHRATVWNLADPTAKPVKIPGHGKFVKAVGFLPGGRTVLTAGLDGTVRIWDAANGAELRSFDWGIGKVQVAAVSPDGTLCAAGGDDGRLVVWDVDT